MPHIRETNNADDPGFGLFERKIIAKGATTAQANNARGV